MGIFQSAFIRPENSRCAGYFKLLDSSQVRSCLAPNTIAVRTNTSTTEWINVIAPPNTKGWALTCIKGDLAKSDESSGGMLHIALVAESDEGEWRVGEKSFRYCMIHLVHRQQAEVMGAAAKLSVAAVGETGGHDIGADSASIPKLLCQVRVEFDNSLDVIKSTVERHVTRPGLEPTEFICGAKHTIDCALHPLSTLEGILRDYAGKPFLISIAGTREDPFVTSGVSPAHVESFSSVNCKRFYQVLADRFGLPFPQALLDYFDAHHIPVRP